jgi:predicted amidophosphoribosyltransferase
MAVIAWISWLTVIFSSAVVNSTVPIVMGLIAGWITTVAWVGLDEQIREGRCSIWTYATLISAPFFVVIYYLLRKPGRTLCAKCGAVLPSSSLQCISCGHTSPWSAVKRVYNSFVESIVRSPAEQAKETVKHLLFALAVVAAFSTALMLANSDTQNSVLIGLLRALSIAAGWVLLAWWVYLDATWRRMEGIPWAVLTLVTSVVGLVTYLVIRYPKPKMCSRCGASIAENLTFCPYCGSQADELCPQCQTPIRPGWQYCPGCSMLLPTSAESSTASEDSSAISIKGSVLNAENGTLLVNAVVSIDSFGIAKSASTDIHGVFRISDLDYRPYILIASADGFVSQKLIYRPETQNRLTFTLYPSTD